MHLSWPIKTPKWSTMIGDQSLFETLSREVKKPQKNNKLMRQILLKYIYICIKFLMYKILFWQLKLVSTIFIFAIKIIFYQKYFSLYRKKLFLSSRFSNFVLPSSSLFFFLGLCWCHRRSWLMINSDVYGIIMSLNWVLKPQIR